MKALFVDCCFVSSHANMDTSLIDSVVLLLLTMIIVSQTTLISNCVYGSGQQIEKQPSVQQKQQRSLRPPYDRDDWRPEKLTTVANELSYIWQHVEARLNRTHHTRIGRVITAWSVNTTESFRCSAYFMLIETKCGKYEAVTTKCDVRWRETRCAVMLSRTFKSVLEKLNCDDDNNNEEDDQEHTIIGTTLTPKIAVKRFRPYA